MKANVDDLYDSFKIGYEAYEASRKEANELWDLYHNRHYTPEQLLVLENRGQPAETFNVIKLFARMLIGYYSTIVNTVTAVPRHPRHVTNAALMNDVINYILEDNRFDIIGDQIKLSGLISGLMCSHTNVVDSGETDMFGRPIYTCVVNHVPDSELVLDPMSKMDDYSDARFLHRFKWMSADQVKQLFGKQAEEKLSSYFNYLNIDEADFEFNYGEEYTGYFRMHDNYLIVHSVMEDDEGKRWSVFWADRHVLLKEEITYKKARWPYRVQKLHSSDVTEYYGLFREALEAQRSLNQAVLKIQLMSNSEKVLVQEGAVENIDDFANTFNRVNAVVEVLDLNGIRVETLSREIQEQYVIIDKALDRLQRVLGINDSFLGMAFASDSGRKVKLQQNASIMSLRYVTARIESYYRSLGEDIANLVAQYYTANQVLAVTDAVTGQRWIELNRPMSEVVGIDPRTGQPATRPILLPEIDPATNEIMEDNEGNIILAPVNEVETEFADMAFTIKVESSAYNDEDEKAQLLLETVMSGQVGQMMSQVNPAGFFKMSSLAMRSMKTKYSPNIAEVLDQTAQMLGQNPGAQQEASMMAQGGQLSAQPLSRSLKLPQNTNEGVE